MTETTRGETARERDSAGDSFASDVAATYAVLAECWREPTEQVIRAAEAGELAPILGPLDSVDRRDLRTEHTRLFVGPAGPPCPPYESVYRDGNDEELGPVMGPTTLAVSRWYREFDVGLAADYNDLPDNVATELEFVAYLAEEGVDDHLEQFLEEHPRRWIAEFSRRVESETREPFYATLAATTREVLAR